MFVGAAEVSFENYDVVIVGSGPAGSTVARRLAALGKKSLILETGKRDYDADVQDSYTKMQGTGHFGSDYWPQHWIRAFGGTSLVWAGWCAPLAARNLRDWPIGAENLSPYYPAAAEVLGRSDAFLTYKAPFVTGFGLRPFSVEDPLRVGMSYLAEFQSSDKIDVLFETTVSELYTDDRRDRITGFRAFHPEVGPRDVSLELGQNLVLAAGGIGNAQILLSSRQQGDVAIGNETDQVGRYLMEHPHLHNCARMVVSSTLAGEDLPADFGAAVPALVPEDDVFEGNDRLDASLELLETDLNVEDNIEQYIIRTLGGNARAFNITIRCEMPPDPLNRVQLTTGTDPSGMSLVRVSCVIPGEALRASEAYLRKLGDSLAREGLGRLRIDNEAIYRDMAGGGHIMGTTRMGDDPASSVVDKNCRVHGYSNLSVAGSSVFTTGGYANPTLTIVALALRLADHLGGTA